MRHVFAKKGYSPVVMKGRKYKGYIYINTEGIKTKKDFDYWIGSPLSLIKELKHLRKRIKNNFY
jgi:hypothetical protein